VLLHFFSYDNVNCWHMLPDLAYLYSSYADGLSIIGVHTPKYPHQQASDNVLKAVNRLGIQHAVVNDAAFELWQRFGVEAWPTVVLIDAEGQVAGVFAGEGQRRLLDETIADLLDEAAERDLRIYEADPPALRLEPRLPLLFPGKVLATDSFLYISDSGHHRVLECSHDGRIQRQFGSGQSGFVDGHETAAALRDPQGLSLHDGYLYIADRGNHAVRRVNLQKGDLDTVLGTGALGRSRPRAGDARSTAMASPLDVLASGRHLHVAVAGQHQLWRMDLLSGEVDAWAGDGSRGTADGAAETASFAQPSDIALFGPQLLVVDAASSAIRAVRLMDGRVRSLIGAGEYAFGDASGNRSAARLQNPLALAVDPRGVVFVADSYNNRIKVLSVKTGELRALNIQYRFSEPSGLSVASGALWVANTNLHEIVRVDLASGVGSSITVSD
ncbi:MAG: thioredoxin-like domain-containing protein, partial [Dokdonella sp.]